MPNSLAEWQGKTALITGASYGIGVAFAKQLAANGTHLILTARSQTRLQEFADELQRAHNIRVTVIAADLAQSEAPQTIFAQTQAQNLYVDLLINNAGFGAVGEFAELPLDRQLEMIQVNSTALVALTHLYLQPMRARRSGAILNVASTASFQGVPYFAVYAATKSFILIFSEALWGECREHGIKVMALCPGSTESNFHAIAGTSGRKGPRQTAEEVVALGLRALAAGRPSVVSGWPNWLMVNVQRFAPRHTVIKTAGNLFKQFVRRQS